MPTASDLYRAALKRARENAYTITVGTYDQMLKQYAATLDRLVGAGSASKLTRQQADELALEMKRFLLYISASSAQGAAASAQLTIEKVSEHHQAALRQIAGDTPIGNRLNNIQGDAFAIYRARNGTAADFETLMRRHARHAADDVDRLVEGMLLTGQSSETAKTQMARLIGANEPRLLQFMDARSAVRRGDLTPDEFRAMGFSPADFAGLKTLMYDARRITVSETNNALRETNRLALTRSPVVRAVKWQTSGAHGDTDECDVLEDANIYGLGRGMYPPENMPVGPHPHCACTAGAVDLLSPSEWAKPRPESGPPKFQGLAHSVKRLGLTGPAAARVREAARKAVRAGHVLSVDDVIEAAQQAAAGVVQTAKTVAAAVATPIARLGERLGEALRAGGAGIRGRSFDEQMASSGLGRAIQEQLGIGEVRYTFDVKAHKGLNGFHQSRQDYNGNWVGRIGLHSERWKMLKDTMKAFAAENADLDEIMKWMFSPGVEDASYWKLAGTMSKAQEAAVKNMGALRTIVHEYLHGVSGVAGRGGYSGLEKAIEEALVDYNAANTFARRAGKSWQNLNEYGQLVRNGLNSAYNSWVEGMAYIIRTFNPGDAGDAWAWDLVSMKGNGTSQTFGGASQFAKRVRAIADQIRPQMIALADEVAESGGEAAQEAAERWRREVTRLDNDRLVGLFFHPDTRGNIPSLIDDVKRDGLSPLHARVLEAQIQIVESAQAMSAAYERY